ncbi:YybS family protein [Geoalkalibacter halelectricus]|uniref:YybS family protein n=1 Tax=Geoalkalibacter halelectricus TaxID=2847045 RepID=A0ABY5ZNP8_9BACT|nr:YybS family protein [Geoalkalibacter halelectricus]MDO3377041.1 YybS family protein [Geoalkalibacter halelectricus]UWZ79505.1 YybS family protein [Geoalkalibacter halelectricus]
MEQRTLVIFGAAVVTAALFLGSQLVPPLALLLNLIGPVPAAYAHMRFGALAGAAVIALSCAALMVLLPPILSLGFLLQYGIAAFCVPLLLRRGLTWDRAIIGTIGIGLAIAMPLLMAVASGQGLGASGLVRQEAGRAIAQALHYHEETGAGAQDREALEQTLVTMAEAFVLIYPAVAIVVLGILAAVVIMLLQVFAKGHYHIHGPPFAQWKAPDFLVWGVIAAGFGLVLNNPAVKVVAANALVILLPVYFVQGLAVVTHFLRRKAVSPMLRSLAYFLIFILNPLPLLVTVMGVFDIWIDFRKPRINKTS